MPAPAPSPAPAGLCPWWMSGLLDNPLRRLLHPPHALLGAFVQPGQRVADVGAGPGFFTLPLCELVGPAGRVYAVDVQPEMLAWIARRAVRRQLRHLDTCLAAPGTFTLPEPADFLLAFWMLHEVGDPATFATALHAALRPGGTLLFAEPLGHVSAATFHRETALLTAAGFRLRSPVALRFSRSLLLEKP